MSATIPMPHDHAHSVPHGGRRWLLATNHKDIGTLYMLFAFTTFLSGDAMALMLRAELFEPGLQIMRPEFLINSPRCTVW